MDQVERGRIVVLLGAQSRPKKNIMHIVITGASSGIGSALAKVFGKKGHCLTLVARRKNLLTQLTKELQCPTKIIVADLSQAQNSTVWIREAEDALGPIDVLINNAGASFVEPTSGVSSERMRSLFQLNLLTPLEAISWILPRMLSQKSGTLINICSEAALTPAPFFSHYNASKAGLAAFSESLRAEIRKSGVNVITVYPGPIETPMAKRNIAQLKKTFFRDFAPTGSPKKLASLVYLAFKKKKARVIYPKVYTIARHFPVLGQWLAHTLMPPAVGTTTPDIE